MPNHSKTTLLLLVGLSLYQTAAASEVDSTTSTPTVEFSPSLRGTQVDGTIFLFMLAYSGSVDIDFLRFTTRRESTLGIRVGAERFETGGVSGSTGGSPYLDYNVLLRTTLSGKFLRFDAYLGFAHHTSYYPQYYPSENLVKYGAELRWKIAPGVFGLLAKANGTKSAGVIGVGLYLGWDQ